MNTMTFRARNPVCFQQRIYTPFRCRAHVVAKSAHLCFRLAAKTALAPLLLLSPQSLRLCGGPRLGRCVLRTRWGAALPKPLARVVAKSAQLRFRLRRKLRSLPCSSFPRATRFAGLARGPHTRFAYVPFLRVRYRQRQIGAHAKNANLTFLGFCRVDV